MWDATEEAGREAMNNNRMMIGGAAVLLLLADHGVLSFIGCVGMILGVGMFLTEELDVYMQRRS